MPISVIFILPLVWHASVNTWGSGCERVPHCLSMCLREIVRPPQRRIKTAGSGLQASFSVLSFFIKAHKNRLSGHLRDYLQAWGEAGWGAAPGLDGRAAI